MAFIDKLADALHAVNKTVSIDIGTWYQPLWNHGALNASKLDRALDMSTYGPLYTDFIESTSYMLKMYSPQKIGIGLCPACLPEPFSNDQLEARFSVINGLGFVQVRLVF